MSVEYRTKTVIGGTDGSGLQNEVFVNITTDNVKELCVEFQKRNLCNTEQCKVYLLQEATH
jgi:hypothetical protein